MATPAARPKGEASRVGYWACSSGHKCRRELRLGIPRDGCSVARCVTRAVASPRSPRTPAEAIPRYVAYLPCASVAVLIASGLVVDLVGPLLGLHEPLRRWPLLIVLNLTLPVLPPFGRRAPGSCELKTSALIGKVRWYWPLFLPLASVAAAARLDNGDGNALAFVVLVAVSRHDPACTVLANRMPKSSDELRPLRQRSFPDAAHRACAALTSSASISTPSTSTSTRLW